MCEQCDIMRVYVERTVLVASRIEALQDVHGTYVLVDKRAVQAARK